MTFVVALGSFAPGYAQERVDPKLKLRLLWDSAVPQIETSATKLGYSVKVAPGEFGTFDVTYSKKSKTDEAHGLLLKKWDQRETIQVRFLPMQDGLQPTSIKRTIEQKAPIGSWKMISENSDIPAGLLAQVPVIVSPWN